MDDSLRARLNPETLAEAGQHMSGHVDAAGLGRRLADALDMAEPAGEVRYALDFERLPNGEVGFSGELRARLTARCQRCLELFELDVKARPHVQISALDEEATPQAGWEPGGDDPAPTLAALIEDELLLALPFAPRHSERDCPAAGRHGARSQIDTQRPFDELEDMLAGRHGSDD